MEKELVEKELTELPMYIIKQRCYTHSARLRPKVKTSRHSAPSWMQNQLPTHYVPTEPVVGKEVEFPGNLDANEYRIWEGSRMVNSEYRRCRGCGSSIYPSYGVPTTTVAEKAALHLKNAKTSCARILVEAYKILLRDKNCVVCEKRTLRNRWGVPLCSTKCVNAWKIETPKSVTHAIEIARKQWRAEHGENSC